jgi:hypothetical protein
LCSWLHLFGFLILSFLLCAFDFFKWLWEKQKANLSATLTTLMSLSNSCRRCSPSLEELTEPISIVLIPCHTRNPSF